MFCGALIIRIITDLIFRAVHIGFAGCASIFIAAFDVVFLICEGLLASVIDGVDLGSAHGSSIIAVQVANIIELQICFGGGAVGVWALRSGRPVIIEGIRGLIRAHST